jgi:hypothetical protein
MVIVLKWFFRDKCCSNPRCQCFALGFAAKREKPLAVLKVVDCQPSKCVVSPTVTAFFVSHVYMVWRFAMQ